MVRPQLCLILHMSMAEISGSLLSFSDGTVVGIGYQQLTRGALKMFDVNLWSFEPLSSLDGVVAHRDEHHAAVNQTCPGQGQQDCDRTKSGSTHQFIVCGIRSDPVTAGKHSAGTMSSHHPTAMILSGMENIPKCQGPLRNFVRPKKSFRAIAVCTCIRIRSHRRSFKELTVKEVYCAIAAIVKTAPIATGPPNMSKPSKAATTSTNHVEFTGVLVFELTWLTILLRGRAPSREYANRILDAVMVVPRPQKKEATMVSEKRASPEF